DEAAAARTARPFRRNSTDEVRRAAVIILQLSDGYCIEDRKTWRGSLLNNHVAPLAFLPRNFRHHGGRHKGSLGVLTRALAVERGVVFAGSRARRCKIVGGSAMRASLVCFVLLLLAFADPLASQTQITTGVIRGIVSDSTGAVLPGVTVDAMNVDTGRSESRTTDGEGRFVFLQLPPGRYTVTFKLSGFATLVQDDVDLTVGQSISLTPRLSVSTIAETVTVSGTTVVETGRSAVATTLNQTTIETTPILGR